MRSRSGRREKGVSSKFTKGQLESSFQWIFVLIAGGAFLVLLFMGLRSCAQQGESRIDGLAVDSAAAFLESAAWQPTSARNVTFAPADVACVAGVLTLSGSTASSGIERAPAFLPSRINGRLLVTTEEVAFSVEQSPALALGSVLFGLDQDTYYFLVTSGSGSYGGFRDSVGSHPNVRTVSTARLGDAASFAVPDSASAIVIVTDESSGYLTNAAILDIPGAVDVAGVFLDEDRAVFYKREGDNLVLDRQVPAEHPLLKLGAAVAGDAVRYQCARQNFLDRALRITQTYESRAYSLADILSFSPCAATLSAAASALGEINERQETYAERLFASSRTLASYQQSLATRSCPVIA